MADHEPELTPELQALLEAVAVGDRAPDDPQITAEQHRNPEFARRLDELRLVQTALQHTGEDYIEALATPATDEQLAAVSRTVTRLADGHPGGTAGGRGRALLWAAALAVFGVGLWLLVGRGDAPKVPQPLGHELVLVAPEAGSRVTAATLFRWRGELAPGERFVFEVRPPGGGEAVWKSPRLRQAEFTPRRDDLDAWPTRFRVTVKAVGSGGTTLAESSAVAFRK